MEPALSYLPINKMVRLELVLASQKAIHPFNGCLSLLNIKKAILEDHTIINYEL